MMQSTSYSTPSNTRPFSVMRSTPRPIVSTSVTFGRLNVGQILVIEGRAFAELAVPRLQRLGGPLVLDDRVDARADLIHLFEIRDLRQASDLFRRYRGVVVPRDEQAAEVADDVGPSVADQVRRPAKPADDQHVEIFHAMLLPSRLQRLHPFGVGRPVAALVDRRRRALEHVQMLRVLARDAARIGRRSRRCR